MKQFMFGLFCATVISSTAWAQDYGLTLGIHNTSAQFDSSNSPAAPVSGTINAKLGFDAGITASFELIPNLRFRTGLLYDQRQVDYKLNNGLGTVSFNFAYVDIPVNAQYNFNQTVGIYGGLIVGIEASDSTSAPSGMTVNPNMKSLYPLVNVGVNFMFQDMIGFDLYYESGLGNAADYVKNYSTYGLHIIYWL